MRSRHYCGLAAATLLTVSSAFAQTTMTEPMPMPAAPAAGTMPSSPMPSSTMPSGTMTPPVDTTGTSSSGVTGSSVQSTTDMNINSRAPASMETTTSGGTMPSTGSSYMSSTPGATDMMISSGDNSNVGRYGRYATGSQLNVNDVHATPQPGSQDNMLFKGN